ncbi:MAG: SulP family inorganic anion transporter [Bacteriovoracaceae bacterium]|jgi:MFS superfamily sulfate permease-like transporter|nr:SulP family inorganic anion transporter [Bacteriovoracaceae bacterium]
MSKNYIKEDLFASFVVFLIALPLCLGVAIASGVDPIKGIFTGLIGGIVVGALNGSPLQISGPSPGLAVMVLQLVSVYGADSLIPLGIMVGAFQILTYIFKVAHFFQATPPALLKAMLSGIGALILLSQIYIMFELKMSSKGLENLGGLPNIFTMITSGALSESQKFSGIIGLGVIVILYLWGKGKHKFFELIPGPLVSIILAAFSVHLFGWEMKMINLPENILANAFNNDYAKAFANIDMGFIPYALGLAFIASAESLLCVSAVDKMAKTSSNYNKVILAQGIGNLLLGFIGAIPVVGVIVRSAANIEFGAKTKLSSVMLGVWIGLFLIIPSVLSYIPIPALAGLLIYTGLRLLDIPHIIDYIKSRSKTSLIFFSTFILTICIDLLTGVIAGFLVSMFILVFDVLKFDLDIEQKGDNKVLKFKGKLSFLDLPVLSKKLGSEDLDVSNLEICLQEVEYLDPAISEHLNDLKDKLESQGKKIEIHYNKLNIH